MTNTDIDIDIKSNASLNQNDANPQLDTIPREIRDLIYDLIFENLSIHVDRFGSVDLHYPWSLTAVSRRLRFETLPLLRKLPVTLTCRSGRLPTELSRRLPNLICQSVKHVTISGSQIEYDLKLSQFPNLELLSIAGYVLARAETFHRMFVRIRDLEKRKAFVIEQCARGILDEVQELHEEQERPREGLEHHYFVEGTLFDELRNSQRKFKVQVEAMFVWGVLDDHVKTIKFDWDTRGGDVDFEVRQ